MHNCRLSSSHFFRCSNWFVVVLLLVPCLALANLEYCWAQAEDSPKLQAGSGKPSGTDAQRSTKPTVPRKLSPEDFRNELNRLAEVCASLKLDECESITKRWHASIRMNLSGKDHRTFLHLPVSLDGAELLGRPLATAFEKSWNDHFTNARRSYAEWLYAEAHEQAKSGDEAAAYRLLWEALKNNPEHAEAQRVLGPLSQCLKVRPRTRRANAPYTEVGWKANSYDRFQTTHFEISSRANANETIELAMAFEQFYVLWTQTFYEAWAQPGVLTARFEGKQNAWNEKRKLSVLIAKDREDYLAAIGDSEANANVSVGYYSSDAAVSLFYPASDLQLTFQHELTHQLFAEASLMDVRANDGSNSGIWLIEGVAIYMESMRQVHFDWVVGGLASLRLQTSRYRAVRDGEWPLWDQFTAASLNEWKADSNIALRYSHAAGLSHCFLDKLTGEDAGKKDSRELFLVALASAYANSNDCRALLALLGDTEDSARSNFQDMMIVTDDGMAEIEDEHETLKSLVTPGSQMKSESWIQLSKLKQLEWLDVAFSDITAEAQRQVAESCVHLKRLSIEGDHTNREFLSAVNRLPQLIELDLSRTNVDASMMEALENNRSIETLWLSHTKLDNKVVAILQSMSALKRVDTVGTEIHWPPSK